MWTRLGVSKQNALIRTKAEKKIRVKEMKCRWMSRTGKKFKIILTCPCAKKFRSSRRKRHHGKSFQFAYTQKKRKRKRFCLPIYSWSSRITELKNNDFNKEPCTNNWDLRTGQCQNADVEKMASDNYRKQWYKQSPVSILTYNTSYHSSNDCEPSRVFLQQSSTHYPTSKTRKEIQSQCSTFNRLCRSTASQNENSTR